jgi:hypothetical protein
MKRKDGQNSWRRKVPDKPLHYIVRVESFLESQRYQQVELNSEFPLSALKNEIVAGPCATMEEAWAQYHARRKEGTEP